MREEILIETEELKKYFKLKEGILKAVDGVNIRIPRGKTVALVGESGCGKSTVSRLILRLIEPTSGRVFFKGKDILSLKGEELKAFRKSVQIIFQDPFASLNPRMSILSTLSEPLKIHKIVPKKEIKEHVAELLRKVGLDPDSMNKYPHEFSGGQRQRICIARALSVNPEIIVADEPLSNLDVSVQAQILNLLADLRAEKNLSYLFITHDLRVVHYFSDWVMVMYLGRIVESQETEKLFSKPLHPYTELLLDSIPSISKPKGERKGWSFLKIEEIPGWQSNGGCPFHPRCPKRFEPCTKIMPELKERDGSFVACHLY